MKRFLFGTYISIIGLLFSAFCFIYAAAHPCDYNGTSGLLGAFLGTDLLIPFTISLIVLIIGLTICCYEAYCKK